MFHVAPAPQPQNSLVLFLADGLFILWAALYAWLAFRGLVLLSASGTILDSDLQTYAQAMARAAFPDSFSADPVLAHQSAANSIQNLQRFLASLLVEKENFGLALLKAGCIAIFCFYCFWYALGRFLFKAPVLAALLALCSGITIWVGWGTFWGLTHSDPVPRVFFAAIFPLLLWLAILALDRAWLRPVAMLACGLSMWVHGVSALNCGAMFFSAFLFLRAPGTGAGKHACILACCLAAFLLPVCIFLWPSLAQGADFSGSDLRVFQEVQALRWRRDFSDYWAKFRRAFSPGSQLFLFSALGLGCWFAVAHAKVRQFTVLLRMIPAFLPGLVVVALLAWLEPLLAPGFGRLSMGHELVRGLRFLVPLAWLLIIAACACYTGKWLRRVILCASFCALTVLNPDWQHLAAMSELRILCGLPPSENAARLIRNAQEEKDFLAELACVVPAGEAVFCPRDEMALRYVARRSLAHSFKDGYVFFYNKDLAQARRWLAIEQPLRGGPGGLEKAWQLSGAPWLLIPRNELGRLSPAVRDSRPVLESAGWLLFRRS